MDASMRLQRFREEHLPCSRASLSGIGRSAISSFRWLVTLLGLLHLVRLPGRLLSIKFMTRPKGIIIVGRI